jgi:hypothetical protein
MEKNPDYRENHPHFLLWSDSENKLESKRFAENILRSKSDNQNVNTFLEPFNPDEGDVPNILKEINLNPDGFDLIWKR